METFVSQVVVVSRPRGRGGSVFISSSSTFRFRFSCAVLGSCRSDVQGRGGGRVRPRNVAGVGLIFPTVATLVICVRPCSE